MKNEPSYISVILEKICEIKGLDYKAVGDTTTSNVLRLFDKNIKL
jgi:Tat protein secretion system quality control protein TatD with DNase activity